MTKDEERYYKLRNWMTSDVKEAFEAGYQAAQLQQELVDMIEWMVAQKISNLPRVDEALKGFAEDSTGDNGTIVVCEVIHAFKEYMKCEK